MHPLPRGPGSRRQRRKAVTAAALRCRQLSLPFRVQWLIEEASYEGGPVRLSLADLAKQTGALRQNVWWAIQRNSSLGRLQVQVSVRGRNGFYQFAIITGTAQPLAGLDEGEESTMAAVAERARTFLDQLDENLPNNRRRR